MRRAAAPVCDLTVRQYGCSLQAFISTEAQNMAIEARIRELGTRHKNLDRAIDDELHRPAADTVRLRELKRQKLKLKEEMEHLRQAHM
jgi:hypothetical protein